MQTNISPRPYVEVRGIYGGMPDTLLTKDRTLADSGLNAVWLGSGGISQVMVEALHSQNARIYAEFNSMHHAGFVASHPDAAPVGADGKVCPPPDGWQGVCPTHPGYRTERMDSFRDLLARFDLDGIWLDYHHSHANWEQPVPNLPDTCFCPRCLSLFQKETDNRLPSEPAQAAQVLLGPLRAVWTAWRCAVYTDWVRQYREIRDTTRPKALFGAFHCPWTDIEMGHALREKLAIDLRAQSAHIDVFSTMPYHVRFDHAGDLDWIARQVGWLGQHLGITGREPGPAVARGAKRIWPIVQLSDWGGVVTAQDVPAVLEAATRLPSTGICVFKWDSLQKQPQKVATLCDFYRAISIP